MKACILVVAGMFRTFYYIIARIGFGYRFVEPCPAKIEGFGNDLPGLWPRSGLWRPVILKFPW